MDITITTTNINKDYEVIDTVFAIDSHKEGFLSSADPSKAFQGVNQQLKTLCKALGGDAIIGCQFEYRNATADGFIGKKQVIEIFAYGTAVKISN